MANRREISKFRAKAPQNPQNPTKNPKKLPKNPQNFSVENSSRALSEGIVRNVGATRRENDVKSLAKSFVNAQIRPMEHASDSLRVSSNQRTNK